jgi:dTDP-4-dehydrorhamnose reductase
MARLLITGASGLLGANLVLAAKAQHEVTAVCHQHPIAVDGVRCVTVDLSRPGAADELIGAERPAWVVHCAAAADVDQCQRDPAWANRLNVEMADRVAEASAKAGARLVHVSTDAVFDGERGGYRESDAPRPVNVYGRTKLEGEQAVLARDPGAAILRTNFFGWHAWGRRGLAEWFLSQFETSKSVSGFVDSWIAPLLVNDLADLILEIAALELSGVYHAVGSECLSKYEFGRRLAVEFGFDGARVRPVPIDEAGLDAPRPRNLCLDNSKLKLDAGLHLPGASEGLIRFRQLKETGYLRELKSLATSVEGRREDVIPGAGDRKGQPWPG